MTDTTLTQETDDMGRVNVPARIINLEDLWRARLGDISADEVRSINVEEALVDTGCVSLGLPQSMVDELGLEFVKTKTFRNTNGPRETPVYQAVRLEVQQRDCIAEVFAVPEDCPVLIGQIPLEYMDFVVNPKTRQLTGNPAHDGEWIVEMY